MTMTDRQRYEYEIQQRWTDRDGWECVYTTDCRDTAHEIVRDYRSNEPMTPVRVVTKRVRENQQ